MNTLLAKIQRLYSNKARRLAHHQKLFDLKNASDKFKYIYDNRLWTSKESISGTGSTLDFTQNIRQHLPKLFAQFKIASVLDAPCGDFNWMQHVLKECRDIRYVGGDIVEALIDENTKKHAADNVSFMTLDITKDKLPHADLIIVRDCLFHLSYADISLFLQNLSKSNIQYILTTGHIDGGVNNTDIVTGDYRDINLFAEPFHWTTQTLDEIEEEGRKLYLFKCRDLPASVKF